jgi:hypothetical protein
MSPVVDNPVIAPDRELEEDKKPGASEPRASAVCSAAGRRATKTNGFAPAAMSGTPSTPEGSVPPACTSGLRPSASRAHGGRRIRSGMRSNEAAGAMDPKKAVIR